MLELEQINVEQQLMVWMHIEQSEAKEEWIFWACPATVIDEETDQLQLF